MALTAPNFFDDFQRIRTRATAYTAERDHSLIIEQLINACCEFGYIGASPQNLVPPAELLPVIAVRKSGSILGFIDPKIVWMSGERRQRESCSNIFLMQNGKKLYPGVWTVRPTKLTLFSTGPDGMGTAEDFVDEELPWSKEGGTLAVICHEIDHLNGRLIVDIARDTFIRTKRKFDATDDDLVQTYLWPDLPFLLLRQGDKYVIFHGSELDVNHAPEVSADALYVHLLFKRVKDLESIFVPRDGELVPIVPSERLRKKYK